MDLHLLQALAVPLKLALCSCLEHIRHGPPSDGILDLHTLHYIKVVLAGWRTCKQSPHLSPENLTSFTLHLMHLFRCLCCILPKINFSRASFLLAHTLQLADIISFQSISLTTVHELHCHSFSPTCTCGSEPCS